MLQFVQVQMQFLIAVLENMITVFIDTMKNINNHTRRKVILS
jgi:hypothetical protein